MDVDTYLALPFDPTEYLIDHFIPKPGRILLVGPPKRGKSMLAIQIAHAVSTGQPFLGRPSKPNGGRVVYLQFDMPPGQWRTRLERLREEGVTFPSYCMDRSRGDFVVLEPTFQRPRLNVVDNPADVLYLQEIVLEQQPDLIVVDTLAKLHSGDENNERSMKQVFHILNDIFPQCAVLYIHHTKKLSPPPGQKAMNRPTPSDAARGSSFMAGEVDAIWLLYNKFLTTEVRFDEDGSYPCEQDPYTLLWKFKEAERLAKVELLLRQEFAGKPWPTWVAFRRYVTDRHVHIPTHLLLRLRAELEPSCGGDAEPPPSAAPL